jgi:hypothetical protein
MMRLELVKTVEEELTHLVVSRDAALNYGTVIINSLVYPWIVSDRIECADSYFASVRAAAELKWLRLRFNGVMKTATKRFHLVYLSWLELRDRGDRIELVALDNIDDDVASTVG